MSRKKFIIAVYNSDSEKRREKIRTTLKDYGFWVQYSVFEMLLTDRQFRELRKKIKGIINPKKDAVRYYRLLAEDAREVIIDGQGQILEIPVVVVD
jgi:CRISPR-associated protein Cas2